VGLLGEIADLAAHGEHTVGRLELADQRLHQRRLAGAVASDEADLVTWLQAERDPVDEGDGADVDPELSGDEHNSSRLKPLPRRTRVVSLSPGERSARAPSGCPLGP